MRNQSVTTLAKSDRQQDRPMEIAVPKEAIEQSQQVLDGWVRSNKMMMEEAAELTSLVTNFSQARMQAEANSYTELMHCHNLKDILDHQKKFAEAATIDYIDQMNKVANHLTSLVSNLMGAHAGPPSPHAPPKKEP